MTGARAGAPRHSRFSPNLVPVEALEQAFVGRGAQLARLVEDVASGVEEGGARYLLLVGPRGAGKSHFSALLCARVRRRVGDAAVVVALDEEEHVGSLLDLLARLLRAFPSVAGVPEPRVQLQAVRGLGHEEAVERVVGMIEARLDGRSLVLAFENADQLFADLGRQPVQVLRRILQSHPGWSVVATSRTVSAAFQEARQPFFQTFAVHPLLPLTPEECRDQLARLADLDEKADLAEYLRTSRGLDRVRAVHHFTGGSPRAMALLYPYLDRARLDDLIEAFYDLSDELTPYFQEQMTRLAPGQRPIVEALAENWRPMSPSELADALFMTPATVSAQLKRLRDDRIVSAIAVGRERFYEIAEPLHRLARAMKRTDAVGETLARFLVHWHERDELGRVLEQAGELAKALEASFGRMATVEREVTEYDRAELEAIKAATPSEMVQLARRFDERRQTPVSAGALIAALLRDVATDTPWLEIEPLAARGPVVVRALAAVVMASLELRVSRTPRDAARYCWLVDSFSGLDVGQHAIAMGLYHSGRLGLALDLLERLDTHLGAVGVELALFVDGDVGAAVERFAKEIRQSLEFGDPELALRVVACLRAGDPGVFSEPLERAEEWRLAAGLLRAVAMDPRRMDGVPALDEAWTVAAGVAALALATDRVDGERAEAAIERLARHTGVPTQPLVSATLALPEDPVPYSRLAAEEREFVRDFLRMLGSDELLAALPPEPT